jgi:hypothetical protein
MRGPSLSATLGFARWRGRLASLPGLLLAVGVLAAAGAVPAASLSAAPARSHVATHFAGKVAKSAPLNLVVQVKGGKIVAITSIVSRYTVFGRCYGKGKFINTQPVKVSHDSFNNRQPLGVPGAQVGGTPLMTLRGKFSNSDTQVKGTLRISDPTGSCPTSTQPWNAKASTK